MSQRAVLIFAGTQTIELRRVCPKVSPGDLVLVYVSSPRMAWVGGFEVAGIISGEPNLLCKKWQAHSGVEKRWKQPAVSPNILVCP
jgi:predicted transcriptional regulator